MKINYYPETDTLYIKLSSKKSTEFPEEIAPGFVLDFGQNEEIVGIEIDPASNLVDLDQVEMGPNLKKKLRVKGY